ncbi:hypothetical protein NCAS_0B06840 [Naumovozyma castellii]|uniref:Uncharacterized protein n=1 Tax=Naumovozyma castellii TaxID=27288 RepID=G0VA38_NAUCA|nr:hypothetical protein NCAS_0B06840 [Naumovozyma castellii CBS 4309]CCC68768.1 hypothetical protein NCAS_0B06840 [Naumovozyma castellii CBS 4309]
MSQDTSLADTTLIKEETHALKARPPVTPPANAIRDNLKSLVAGGVGGVCAVLTGHPFDLIKVRCQSGQASSTIHAIKIILKDARAIPTSNMLVNSVKGFYKGVIPPLLGVTPIFAVSFWGYDVGKKIVTRSDSSSAQLTMGQMAAAGFISAIPTTLVTAPTERIKVVLQTAGANSKTSFIGAAKNIVKDGGVKSLFKGSLATLARDGPGSALYFASYEISKKFLNDRNATAESKTGEVNIANVCLAGGIAGMSMWLVVFPIDTIKTKLQSSSGSQSMVAATREIYVKRGGIKGFFPGLGPALLRSFPANAATFLGVELTHSLFKKYNI